MWKGVHLNQNKYLPAQRTSRSLLRGGGVLAAAPAASGPFWPPAAAGRVAAQPGDCVSSIRTETRRGWPGEHKGPAASSARGPRPRAGCRLAARSGLAIVFSLAFWRAPYYLFLFSLFYFYFQVAGRAGCRPFTPLPWSAARRQPEPARAQPRGTPAARTREGRSRGWGTGVGGRAAGDGRGGAGAGGGSGGGRGGAQRRGGLPGSPPQAGAHVTWRESHFLEKTTVIRGEIGGQFRRKPEL